jgi:hypothetical protein
MMTVLVSGFATMPSTPQEVRQVLLHGERVVVRLPCRGGNQPVAAFAVIV